ncbi:N-acetylmuramoyl-L-alanine amidase [Tenacibaculum sp. UWU-22]|uniref:N-acetylmuramoyl-L-alanine amidase n=1 Tax=Tenacibaculum sp. UWU-22 TaxID=3234187 RepID=UPI0034DB5179
MFNLLLFQSKYKYIYLFIIIGVFSSCSTNIYKIAKRNYKKEAKKLGKSLRFIPVDTINNKKVTVIESQNFSLRKPNFIIIHHTAQDSCKQTYKTFALQRTQVSSHYVICKDGGVTKMLNELLRGWHAGNSSWGKVTDLNSVSIGIELDNNGEEPFAQPQINSFNSFVRKINQKI